MGTRIFKIEGELSQIIDSKVGSPQNSLIVNQKICYFELTLKSDIYHLLQIKTNQTPFISTSAFLYKSFVFRSGHENENDNEIQNKVA